MDNYILSSFLENPEQHITKLYVGGSLSDPQFFEKLSGALKRNTSLQELKITTHMNVKLCNLLDCISHLPLKHFDITHHILYSEEKTNIKFNPSIEHLSARIIGKRVRDFVKSLLNHPSLLYLDLSFSLDRHDNKNDLEALYEVIEKYTELHTLRLSHNLISGKQSRILSSYLSSNRSLCVVDLSHNYIGNGNGVNIVQIIEENPTITDLNIAFTGLKSRGTIALALALRHNSRLESLDLSGNGIKSIGIKFLSDALIHNTTLTKLVLNRNLIGPISYYELDGYIDGCRCLGEMLNHNTTLTYLDLRSNQIYWENNIKYLCSPTLKVLQLSHNQISYPQMLHLMYQGSFDFLNLSCNNIKNTKYQLDICVQPSIKKLKLQKNQIRNLNDIGIWMQYNTSLEYLDLSWNIIDDISDLKDHPSLRILLLKNNQITKYRHFFENWKLNNSLGYLNLGWNCNSLSKTDAEGLSNYLIENTTLQKLDLTLVNLSSSADYLGNALRINTTLKSLNLSSCFRDSSIDCLLKNLIFNSGLECLDISYNNIGGYNRFVNILTINIDERIRKVKILGDLIRINTSLTSLDIKDTDIHENEFTYIVDALSKNTTLRKFTYYFHGTTYYDSNLISKFGDQIQHIINLNNHNYKQHQTTLFELLFNYLDL